MNEQNPTPGSHEPSPFARPFEQPTPPATSQQPKQVQVEMNPSDQAPAAAQPSANPYQAPHYHQPHPQPQQSYQQPHQPAQQFYGQPYQQQPYQQPMPPGNYYQGYGPVTEAAPKAKPATLGIIMFAISVLGAIIISWPWTGATIGRLNTLVQIDPEDFNQYPHWLRLIALGLMFGILIQIVAFIGSIVAMVTKRGLLWAVAACLGSIAFPVIGWIIALAVAGVY